MKQYIKKSILLTLSILISIVANAYDFEVGGIYYNKDGNSAIVTSGDSKYSGDVSIPSTVNYGGMEYSVKSIGDYAFGYCSGLTSVTIGNSVTSIGGSAFWGCSSLTSVTIPNSVTSIGHSAFFGCSGLTSVTIGNSVTSIGDYAFSGCSGLTSVTIPNSVTTIGFWAFTYCSGLTSVTIPNSVTSIGDDAFYDCSGLTSIKVESGNTTYDSRNDCNAIIETASNKLVTGCKNTVIPNSVTSIGNSAFSYCSGLTSVTIPNSVTSIGNNVFYRCRGLTSVTIGNSVTSIGSSAFQDCSGLTSVTIPNSVTSIGNYAFSGCSNLKSVISEIEIPFTIASSVFDSDTETNGQLTVPKGKKSVYQSTDGWKEFSNIVESISSYTLTIQSSSSGYVSYNGSNISATTKTFTIDEGSSVTFTITPNTGYYLSKLTVNGTDVTTSVSNNQYTISYITANISVVATFEKIVTGIEVNATNFPDAEFRNWIMNNISGASDGWLTDSEIAEVKRIDCRGTFSKRGSIASLQGIEFFTELTHLYCSYNQLTSLDVSKNMLLEVLYCEYNQLTSLDVSKNMLLKELRCHSNQLTSLDVSNTLLLIYLYCEQNQLTSLDVSNTLQLIDLDCDQNQLTSLDVSKNMLLEDLSCSYNQLTILNVSKNTALKRLNCESNQLTSLDVSNNTELTKLYCYSNQLTSLDVSNNTELTELFCYSNQLTSLDVSNNTELTKLNCHSNQLTSLDVSNNTALTNLSCYFNQLTSLDVSKNTALTFLWCYSNQLTSLDVSNNTALNQLFCHSNQLTNLDLSNNSSINFASIGSQTTSLKAVNTSAGIAIPVPSDFDFTKVSNLKLDGASVSGSFATFNGQKYLVFAQAGTAQSSIDGKQLTFDYSTGNSFSDAASMDVTVSLSYDAPKTYTLSIQSGSGGSVSYDGTTITNATKSFTVVEGTSATISILPNSGYKLSKLTVNGTNVTSSVSNNQYTISNITANTTVVATFEQITYTLSVQASGMGVISYNNNSIKNATRTYTVNHGASATFTITPDAGYRLASLTVNGTNVTSSVSNGKYTVSNITANSSVVATFEQIPVTNYTLSIQSGSGGSVSYEGTAVTNTTKSFTVAEGSSAIVTITPNTGYKLSKLTVNGTNVTSSVKNNRYTISNITANTSVIATFEQITYTLSLQATGNGTVTYNSTSVKNTTRTFTVNHGSSATLTITPDAGYRLSSLTVNGTNVSASVSNGKYTIGNITANTSVVATFEQIPVTTYTLSIQSGSGGSVSYDGTTVTNTTKSFTVAEGSSATLTITPNDGYRLASLTVNGTNVTSSVSSGKYTINSITANTSVVATFEEIPITNYTLSIQAGSGGSISYDGTTVTNTTKSFTVAEGSNVTLTITPNDGYRLASLTVNGTNVTSSVSNGKYTINSITANTSVIATFEEIPATTYTLTIQSGKGGSVSYNGMTVADTKTTFTVTEGEDAILVITPDSGYQLASLTVDGRNVTSEVAEGQYTIRDIRSNTTVVASFEQITYTLSVQATGNGSVIVDNIAVKNSTRTFTVGHGTTVVLSFHAEEGCRLSSLSMDGTNVTSGVIDNQYEIVNITSDVSVSATFKEIPQAFSQDGINYEIESEKDHTLNVGSGEYSGHVVIPATVTHGDETWTVTGVADGAFDTPAITAITWNPSYAIGSGAFGNLTNPNLLLYVKDAAYAPENVQNVIANGRARKIVLTDAASGNDFDCPKAFTAEEISYTHRYSMTTGIGECRGWETIALPFDVKQFTHETKGMLIPFRVYSSSSNGKPFWLYQLTASGWQEAATIEANKPYIISLPNNEVYYDDYNLPGTVTLSSKNVTIPKTEPLKSTYNDRTFVVNFKTQASSWNIYALNVNNDFSSYEEYLPEGSTFIRELRTVHPFEAYMTTNSSSAKEIFSIFEDMPTAIREIPQTGYRGGSHTRIFNLSGQAVAITDEMSLEQALSRLPHGIYIVNGKKVVIK